MLKEELTPLLGFHFIPCRGRIGSDFVSSGPVLHEITRDFFDSSFSLDSSFTFFWYTDRRVCKHKLYLIESNLNISSVIHLYV